jgi:hypothetical protein
VITLYCSVNVKRECDNVKLSPKYEILSETNYILVIVSSNFIWKLKEGSWKKMKQEFIKKYYLVN